MPVETENFLNAEQAAQALLTDLEQLKREVEGYANAKEHLAAAGSRVTELASKLSQLAERSQTVIEFLGRIGTPEILQQIDALRTTNTGLIQSTNQLTKDVRDSQARASGSYEKITAAFNAMRDAVTKVGEGVEQVRTNNANELAAMREALTRMSEAVEQGRIKSAKELAAVHVAIGRRVSRLTLLVAIGIPVVTALIVGAAVVFGPKLTELIHP